MAARGRYRAALCVAAVTGDLAVASAVTGMWISYGLVDAPAFARHGDTMSRQASFTI